jgi:phosphatidylserine/phosphatidylglycerophosphate/cardiolipin synthase-like enzyme
MFSMRGRIEGKPIGRAFAMVFRSAAAGDTFDIAGKKVGTESFSLIAKALSKGCHVNLLVNHGCRMWVEYRARRLYADRAAMPPGRLTIRHYAPNEHLVRQQNLNAGKEHILHAKNYVLTRRDGSCVVMTGSYNLDGQSHYRSNENLMVFEAPDAGLRRALFDDLHGGSDSKVSRYPAPRPHAHGSTGCWARSRPFKDAPQSPAPPPP